MIDGMAQALTGAINAFGSGVAFGQSIAHGVESTKKDIEHEEASHKAAMEQKEHMHKSAQMGAASDQSDAAAASAEKKMNDNAKAMEQAVL